MNGGKKIFCTHCGMPIDDGTLTHCPNCGEPLFEETPMVNTPIMEQPPQYIESNIPYIPPMPPQKGGTAKKVLIALLVVVLGIVGAGVGAMYYGAIDGTKLGIVNEEKSLAKIDRLLEAKDYGKASSYALAAQKGKSRDKEFLTTLVKKLNPICPFKTYIMVKNYAQKVGEKNLDETVAKWLKLGKTPIVLPEVTPKGNSFAYAPTIILKFNDAIIGRGIFYTLDGSEPTVKSPLYYDGIKIPGDCTLKYIAINGEGKTTEVVTVAYEIDGEKQKEVDTAIEKAESLYKTAVVGDQPGQCLKATKDTLDTQIKFANDHKLQGCTIAQADSICKNLNTAIEDLNKSIMSNSDRTAFNTAFSAANEAYNAQVTSSYAYELNSDLSALKKKIDEATALKNNRSADQPTIDNATKAITEATNAFKRAVDSVKLDAQYQSLVGEYYYSNGSGPTVDSKSADLNISKISHGKVSGNFIFDRYIYDDPYNFDESSFVGRSGTAYFNDVAINNGKISFDISGNLSYSSNGYAEDYTSHVTISLNSTNDISVTLSNIGNGESATFSMVPYNTIN